MEEIQKIIGNDDYEYTFERKPRRFGVFAREFSINRTGKFQMETFDFFEKIKPAVYKVLSNELRKLKSIKFQLQLDVSFSKATEPNILPEPKKINLDISEISEEEREKREKEVVGDLEFIYPYFLSKQIVLLLPSEIPDKVDEAFDKVISSLDNFTSDGSGWLINEVEEMLIKTTRYVPIKGGSYIQTPRWLAVKRAVVNVKNNDQKCFR